MLVVAPDIDPDVVGGLRERRPDIELCQPETPDDAVGTLADHDPAGLVCRNSTWRDAYLDGLDAGDWVVTKTTGYENVPVEAFRERGVVFSNAPGVTAAPVADHAIALLLSVSRRLRTYHGQQTDRRWERRPDGMTDFAGADCCVVGLGRIGEAVAARARGFDMTVRGVKRSVGEYDGAAETVHPAGGLLDALDGARAVVLSVPLTAETRGLVGTPELRAVADDAVVVNVCRGPVLDTDALVGVLEADRLLGAGVDVVDDRPPGPEWPLWDRDDVVVTPHVAGRSDRTPDRLSELLVAEYDRWIGGREPRHRIV